MNFDDDDDTDFSLSPQSSSNNKLASLFKMSNESGVNESLRYKAPKQPQQQQQVNQQSQQPQQSQMMFFSHIQAFKYLNNQYEPQGKLGLVIMPNQGVYQLILYVVKTQPTAMIKITSEFKIALQKNNYSSFYDDSRQLWSILFESDESVASFATQITLCKCNLMQNNIENANLCQDLKVNNDSDANFIESGDSIEIETLVTVFKENKLTDVIENTQQKSFKLKLGKNKLAKRIEDSILNMKQGERKLFVLTGSMMAPFYSNLISSNTIIFYDINILKIKKNEKKERTISNATNNSSLNEQQYPLPQLNTAEPETNRLRADSVKDKTKIISDQLNDSKLDKAKLISRMAKMGQPMLPQMMNTTSPQQPAGIIYGVEDEDWEQQSQMNTMQDAVNKAAFLMQQQQQQQQLFQQQIAFQNQLNLTSQPNQFNQQMSNNNQLALFKSASPQLLIYPQQQQQQQQQIPVQVESTSSSKAENSIVLNKLDTLNEKIDSLKQITQLNNQNLPSMETNVLLQNIQRIVKENEQYKKDLYDKSNKIEEQNAKITELLMKAQNYVEQSHQILELKNSAFQSNAEKTVNKVLELEQDKMRLTGDLSKLTAQISELNLEVNKMQKNEAELKQQLIEVSKNTDTHKQTSERLLIENADLQTKLDTIVVEYKKERQLRKSLETKVNLNEEELNELRSNLNNNQRLLDEKKRKTELDKAQFDRELDDIKAVHVRELAELKERLNTFKTKGSEIQNEQIKQIEYDLNREWQSKLDKTIQQYEQKYERQINGLNEEKKDLERQLNDSKEAVKSLRINLSSQTSKFDADTDNLKQNLEEMNLIKGKYERLQNKALQMKETYDTRIKELLDADPDPEIIAEELKKVMNLIFKQLKKQIKSEEYYAGNGILSAMLKIIKMYTLRILQSNNSNEDDENEQEIDFFSQHIYKVPELSQSVNINWQPLQTSSQPHQIQDENSSIDQIDSEPQLVKSTEVSEIKAQVINKQIDEQTVQTNAFNQLLNSNIDDDDDDEDDDDRSIQLINDDEEEEEKLIINENLKVLHDNKQEEVQNKEQQVEQQQHEEVHNETLQNENEEEDEIEEKEKEEVSTKQVEENEIDDDDDKENEIDLVQEKIQAETIGEISPLHEDLVVESNETNQSEDTTVEQEQKNEIKEQSEQPPAPPPTSTSSTITKSVIKSTKGLFDDEDDDEDQENDGLFSFSKNNKTVIENKEALSKSNETAAVTAATSTTTSVNLKFSPPPLFSNDDDSSEKEIDWFK